MRAFATAAGSRNTFAAMTRRSGLHALILTLSQSETRATDAYDRKLAALARVLRLIIDDVGLKPFDQQLSGENSPATAAVPPRVSEATTGRVPPAWRMGP